MGVNDCWLTNDPLAFWYSVDFAVRPTTAEVIGLNPDAGEGADAFGAGATPETNVGDTPIPDVLDDVDTGSAGATDNGGTVADDTTGPCTTAAAAAAPVACAGETTPNTNATDTTEETTKLRRRCTTQTPNPGETSKQKRARQTSTPA